MKPAWPRYVLFSEAQAGSEREQNTSGWRFVLSSVDSQHTIAASDIEADQCLERLELMAVVRGLEALDHPSLVTLVSGSRYVRRGIQRGLKEWRASDWKWERFGRRVLVRDHDLWRRVDRALEFHRIECRLWRLDSLVTEADEVSSTASSAEVADLRDAKWRAASTFEETALLVVRPPKPARRGVIRFNARASSLSAAAG